VTLLKNAPFVHHAAALLEICPAWPRDWKKLAAWLRERNYEAIIVPFCRPWELLRASAASGARRRIAMGTTLKAAWLARLTGHSFHATDFVRRPRPYYEIVAECASSLVDPSPVEPPRLVLAEPDRMKGKSLLLSRLPEGLTVGIHPLCLGNTCNLPLETYREIIRLILRETNWGIVITGSQSDQAALGKWPPFIVENPQRIWNSSGNLSLTELTNLISVLDAYVVPSTGPLHIAHALQVPTVTPFCPQMPVCARVWGYAPYEKTTVEPAQPPCDPTRPHTLNCDFRGSISAQDVMHRLKAILQAR
jgi:ADP-heptose:LPS heptosyltransferase